MPLLFYRRLGSYVVYMGFDLLGDTTQEKDTVVGPTSRPLMTPPKKGEKNKGKKRGKKEKKRKKTHSPFRIKDLPLPGHCTQFDSCPEWPHRWGSEIKDVSNRFYIIIHPLGLKLIFKYLILHQSVGAIALALAYDLHGQHRPGDQDPG